MTSTNSIKISSTNLESKPPIQKNSRKRLYSDSICSSVKSNNMNTSPIMFNLRKRASSSECSFGDQKTMLSKQNSDGRKGKPLTKVRDRASSMPKNLKKSAQKFNNKKRNNSNFKPEDAPDHIKSISSDIDFSTKPRVKFNNKVQTNYFNPNYKNYKKFNYQNTFSNYDGKQNYHKYNPYQNGLTIQNPYQNDNFNQIQNFYQQNVRYTPDFSVNNKFRVNNGYQFDDENFQYEQGEDYFQSYHNDNYNKFHPKHQKRPYNNQKFKQNNENKKFRKTKYKKKMKNSTTQTDIERIIQNKSPQTTRQCSSSTDKTDNSSSILEPLPKNKSNNDDKQQIQLQPSEIVDLGEIDEITTNLDESNLTQSNSDSFSEQEVDQFNNIQTDKNSPFVDSFSLPNIETNYYMNSLYSQLSNGQPIGQTSRRKILLSQKSPFSLYKTPNSSMPIAANYDSPGFTLDGSVYNPNYKFAHSIKNSTQFCNVELFYLPYASTILKDFDFTAPNTDQFAQADIEHELSMYSTENEKIQHVLNMLKKSEASARLKMESIKDCSIRNVLNSLNEADKKRIGNSLVEYKSLDSKMAENMKLRELVNQVQQTIDKYNYKCKNSSDDKDPSVKEMTSVASEANLQANQFISRIKLDVKSETDDNLVKNHVSPKNP